MKKIIIFVLFPLFLFSMFCLVSPAFSEDPPLFLLKWGGYGSGYGQFSTPIGLAVDSTGCIYVADSMNKRVQKFSPSGDFLMQIITGEGNHTFDRPVDVAVGNYDNIYVLDSVKKTIQKFDAQGTHVKTFVIQDTIEPSGIAVGPSGVVHVTYASGNYVCNFTEDGPPSLAWGARYLISPRGIAVDSAGNIYIASSGNHKIFMFLPTGGEPIYFGGMGTGDGQFQNPVDVSIDKNGNIFVVDQGNFRIQKFGIKRNFLTKWGSFGTGDGQFGAASGVAAGPDDNIYVSDSKYNCVQKFGPNRPPVANAGPDITVEIGQLATFDGSASYDPDNDIIGNYAWDLGDGRQKIGEIVTNVYNNVGTYTVTLEVEDTKGATGRDTCIVTVKAISVTGNPLIDNLIAVVRDPVTGAITYTDPDTGLSTPGAYVSAVAAKALELRNSGQITQEEFKLIMKNAGNSDVNKKNQ